MNFIFIILSLFTQVSFGYELMPEYVGFSEKDRTRLDRIKNMGSEAESDVLTYSFSPDAQSRWWVSDKAFRSTMGSLGFKHFLVEFGMKAQAAMSEKVTAKAFYVEQEDYLYNLRHLILELEYQLSEKWSIAGYGQSEYEKSHDDFGTAIIFRPRPEHAIRFFATWTNFNYNLQNTTTDEYSQSPMSLGFVGRGESFEYVYRSERPMIWKFPDSGNEFRFSRTYGAIRLLHGLNSIGLMHRRELATENGVSAEVERRIFDFTEDQAGFRYVHSDFKTSSGNVSRRDYIPYYWLKPVEAREGHGDWGVVYEVTFHWAEGPEAIRSEEDENYVAEHRLNVAWEWLSTDNARLKLHFTFDADNLISPTLWEGGNGQFEMYF